MGVSKNRGTPKWMVYNGNPYQNGWFGGIIIFGNTQNGDSKPTKRRIWITTFFFFNRRPVEFNVQLRGFFFENQLTANGFYGRFRAFGGWGIAMGSPKIWKGVEFLRRKILWSIKVSCLLFFLVFLKKNIKVRKRIAIKWCELRIGISQLWFFKCVFFTDDPTRGFITIFHHHLGNIFRINKKTYKRNLRW